MSAEHIQNCSDLKDLCSILLNCYVGDDSYICFIKSSPLLSNNPKQEGQIQMKKTNACIVDFTPPLWVVKSGKKDMAC